MRYLSIRKERLCLFVAAILCPFFLLAEENPPLIDIKDVAPGIILDIRYASTNNFTKQKHYNIEKCLLIEPAAKRLARVQKKLEKKGLGLKVFDCYRPLHVQKKLWKAVPDPRYVADPKKGSRHNRGASIDLTLVDKNGDELPMPTDYDDFSKKAHRDYKNLSEKRIKNRGTLEAAMHAEGFIGLATEWWHFDDPEWKDYALRDEPLESETLMYEKRINKLSLPVPMKTKQLVVVQTSSWSATTGRLTRYERKGTKWKKVSRSWPISIGSKGIAKIKREGDKAAPSGVFKIGQSYGYNKTPPEKTKWPYTQVNSNWVCVDDPNSASYNKIFPVGLAQTKDWKSAEKMRRKDHLYKWVINIEHNYPVVEAGAGSCIFFHVWRKKNAVTRGCTAMSEDNMMSLIQWLNPKDKPMLVQFPKSEYKKVKKKWKLP